MTREHIESELKAYKENAARLAELVSRAADIEREIFLLRSELCSDPSGIGASRIDGMPHTQGNTSIVERMALMGIGDTPEIYRLQHELYSINDEIYKLGRKVCAVERWISALSERERVIIEAFYFDGLWLSVARRRYEERYALSLSHRRAKQIKRDALQKIERVVAG